MVFLATDIDNFPWNKNSNRNEGRNDFYIDQGVLLRTENVWKKIEKGKISLRNRPFGGFFSD